MIPLAGQGKPLPLDFPYKGEWLLENVLFFCVSDAAPLRSDRLELTVMCSLRSGRIAAGINSATLAALFGLSVGQIFDANRSGSLSLLDVREAFPEHGGRAAKRYVFSIGGRTEALVIEDPSVGGSA